MKRLIYFFPLVAALLLGSCNNECEDCDFEPVKPQHSRILFHYLAMDNDLSQNGRRNVADMVKGATTGNMNDGAIVVFYDMLGYNSQLLYIKGGETGGQQVTLYDWGEDLDSSDPATFTKAFDKARELLDADSWALAAGSHGTGWIPYAMQNSYMTRSLLHKQGFDPLTRALFADGYVYMDIDKLIEVIPSNTFDFIIMDLCFMGGIEFAYALRNKTRQLVLSPAEVLAHGMPYDRIMQYIFATTPKLGEDGVCEEYYNYYLNDHKYNEGDANETPGNKFATMALYDCTKFDALAGAVRAIVVPKESVITDITTSKLNTKVIQYLDRYSKHTMFDLAEFIHYIHPEDDELRQAFDVALDNVVVYKNSSEKSLGGLIIPNDRFCGISTYIPIGQYSNLNTYYWQTEWGGTVYQQGGEAR